MSAKTQKTTTPTTTKKKQPRKPIEDESYLFDEIVELVCELIALRSRKYEIKKLAERGLGFSLNGGQFTKLLAAARNRMLEKVSRDVETHKAEAHGFYEAAIREAPEWKDRIAAQKELSQLHGLVQSGKPTPEQQNITDDERAERVREVLRQMHESTSGGK